MKKLITLILTLFMLTLPIFSFEAMAEQEVTEEVTAEDVQPEKEEIPSLVSITFNNAKINEKIEKDVYNYTVTLDGNSKTPTLKSYEISGSGEIFVNYSLDSAKHQTGIIVTLQYFGGSLEYTFDYTNPAFDTKSGNNFLESISCPNCKVYPEINDKTVIYKLFVPSDLTELRISTVTKDINAYCDLPEVISLSADQEPELSITVTAANGETRLYKLKIKRLDKTAKEVEGEIKEDGSEAIVKNELFFNNPVFLIAVCAAAAGILFIILALTVIKRITVKPEDTDEKDFFEAE